MRLITILMLGLVLVSGMAVCGQDSLLPNGSFEEGQDVPAGWRLSGGEGKWDTVGRTGQRSVSVTGTGTDSNYWACTDLAFDPKQTYRITYYARSIGPGGGGCVISGPNFVNRDFFASENWERYSFVFIPVKDPTGSYIRLGQWHRKGTVSFDDVRLTKVAPVHATVKGIQLGHGERIAEQEYEFEADLGYEGSNYSRCLVEHTAGFNTNRWVFSGGQFVVYKHQVGELTQEKGRISIAMPYYVSGECVLEASKDGRQWIEFGRVGEQKSSQFEIPTNIYPAKVVYVRLRAPGKGEETQDSAPGSFQINTYDYRAKLVEKADDAVGSTRFLDVVKTDERINARVESLGELKPGGENRAVVLLKNNARATVNLRVVMTITRRVAEASKQFQVRTHVPGTGQKLVNLPYQLWNAGDFDLRLSVFEQEVERFAATTSFTVSSLYAADFGHLCGSDSSCDWWWCDSTYKISKERPAPGKQTMIPVAEMSAAKGEYESVQLVLRPKRDLKDVTWKVVAADDMLAKNINLLEVAYHYVKHPTDYSGCVGWWPDALPPVKAATDLKAEENHPIWVILNVPRDARAGVYKFRVVATAAGGKKFAFPIRLRVYDFEISRQPHLESGFGVRLNNIVRYHNLKTIEEKRKVWDLYMQNFREHRMCPFNFAPLDPIHVDFAGITWVGGEIVEEQPAEGKMCLKLVDNDQTRTVSCQTDYHIPVVPGKTYRLSWSARTEKAGQKYLVTFNTYDGSDQWISGSNIDMAFAGETSWKRETKTIVVTDYSPKARFVVLYFRPTLWTEKGEYVGTAWFDDISLVEVGKEDEPLVKNGGFEMPNEAARVKLDFSRWDEQARKYLDNYGFSSFVLSLHGMGSGTFHSRRYGQIGPFKQGSDGYRRLFKEYCTKLQDHLEHNGWLNKAYIYWFDEPQPNDYDFVREGMQEIKLAGPKLRRMLTEEPVESLFGAVDLWCPVLHNHRPEICRERQQKGETIWWYVCCSPRAPYPGLFIDHDAIDLRMWLWMTWKWQVQGILIWDTTYWTSPCAFPDPKNLQNPWEDPMGYVSGFGYPAGYINYWGNGDGRFFYPPNRDVNNDKAKYVQGPVTSIRWEMLREGLEDYEYFWTLRDTIEKARKQGKPAELITQAELLLEIPQHIITDKTHFTRDPQRLYEHRHRLAEMIEKLRD